MKLLEAKRVDLYLESPFPTYLINRSGFAHLLLRRWKSGMTEYRAAARLLWKLEKAYSLGIPKTNWLME
jgi:hypothetical protein